MLRNFNHDDFERFLNKNADQFRMQPTARVWKNISKSIHKKKRYFGFVFGALLISLSFAAYYFVDTYAPFKQVATVSNNTNAPIASIPAATADKLSAKKNSGTNTLLKINSPTSLSNKKSIGISKPVITVAANKIGETASVSKIQPAELLTATISKITVDNSKMEIAPPLLSLEEGKLPVNESTPIYKSVAKNHKLNFEFFFTPTVSYRHLSENKMYINTVSQTSAPYNVAALYNINDLVTHKPDMGLELAFLAKYPLSKKIKLRSGLQFNMSRYEIKALNNYTPQLTTITLNSRFAYDNITAVSNYRNTNALNADWLQNLYFQISLPVGLEAMIAGNTKTQWGIASTIQPTRIIGDRAYLLSSDYKNYALVPWLIRRWNMDASFETFVSYSSGHIQWQVGPQVRYQLLSSFIDKYPVKEHLFDYGLKVGLSIRK